MKSHLLDQLAQYDAFLAEAEPRHQTLGQEIAEKKRARAAIFTGLNDAEKRSLGITGNTAPVAPSPRAKN